MNQERQSESISQKISYVLKGNADAVAFFLLLRDILHFWDDLIDGDRELTHGDVNLAMFKALVALPRNQFYTRFFAELNPILVNAIANWQAANDFERGEDKRRLQLAYVIRSDYANLLIQSAFIIGGYDWLTHVTPIIRDTWTAEDFPAYIDNLKRERAAKSGDSTQLVKEWYQQETAEYLKHGLTVFQAAMYAPTEEEHVAKLYQMINPPAGAKIIDMGAGAGGVSLLMSRIDPTAKFVCITNVKSQFDAISELVEARVNRIFPIMCDFHSVPKKSNWADVVMFNESIGYGSLPLLLRESYRLLKPGGVLAVKDSANATGVDSWSTVWQWATHGVGKLDALAQEIGFEIVESKEMQFDSSRYDQFISENEVMRSRYANSDLVRKDTRAWFWLLRKPAHDETTGDQHVL